MFPDKLDNAKVLYYTSRNEYRVSVEPDGGPRVEICYLAICKYDGSPEYYLFECNGDCEVEFDYECESVKECMSFAGNLSSCDIVWIKK